MSTMDSRFLEVPIEITVVVGRARPLLSDLLAMTPDDVLPLDRKTTDPVDLFVGDRLVARGELMLDQTEDGQQLSVRIVEIEAPEDTGS